MPLDDLAVHEPDARKLIAFLKAMEFSTLTRRVADYSQIDPADIEPDASNKSGAASLAAARHLGRRATAGIRSGLRDRPAPRPPPQAGRGSAQQAARRQDKASSLKGTPISLAAARAEAARKMPVDRSKYQTIRSLDQLKAWIARVHDVGHFAIEAMAQSIDPMQAEICGIALALAPNDACYVPLAHKQSGGGAGLFDAGLAPDQIKAGDALARIEAAAGIRRAF